MGGNKKNGSKKSGLFAKKKATTTFRCVLSPAFEAEILAAWDTLEEDNARWWRGRGYVEVDGWWRKAN